MLELWWLSNISISLFFHGVFKSAGRPWTGLIWLKIGRSGRLCSHRNGPEDSIICGEFLKDMRNVGRRRRRRRKLLYDLKERRGYSHLKEEALDRTVCRAGFGRGFGPVVRETAK